MAALLQSAAPVSLGTPQGFTLGWYAELRWGVSTGLRERAMGWLVLRGCPPVTTHQRRT